MHIQRLVDLSVPIDDATVVYPGDPSPQLQATRTVAEDGFNILGVHMGSQSGTHVDAPFHFQQTGARIDAMDLGLFMGPATLVDAAGLQPRAAIGWEHFAPVADQLQEGTVVLLHTGWARHYGSPLYFEHPYLDGEACRRLLDRGVRTILVDAINLDETPDDDHPGVGYPCHHAIAAVGGVIGENLRHFELVDWDDPWVMALPLKLAGADGAPVRAVAVEWGDPRRQRAHRRPRTPG